MNIIWKKADGQLPNLHVLEINALVVGFVYKPKDTKTDKNAWRAHFGVGEHTTFLGHDWSIQGAKTRVELKVMGQITA